MGMQRQPGLSRSDQVFAPGDRSRRVETPAEEWLLGNPIPTASEVHQRLNKIRALAVFSSDALSSVAYATEEIMKVLVLAGAAMLYLTLPIAVVIVALLAIIIVSYRQTIRAYPSNEGAYTVAKENLVRIPACSRRQRY